MKNKGAGWLFKTVFTTAAFLSAVDGLNRLTARFGEAKLKTFRRNENDWAINIYKSRYGNLRYKKAGRGAPLLLLHGLDGQEGLNEWRENLAALSRHFTVYSLEFPGYGFSDKPEITYSSYLFSTVVADFLTDIVKGSAYVAASGSACGVCLGAHILNPAYFRRIILISPTGAGSSTLPTSKIVKGLLRLPILSTTLYNIIHSKSRALAALRSLYSPCEPLSDQLKDHADQRRLPVFHNPKGARQLTLSAMYGHLNTDLRHLIKNAALPIHIIWGGSDKLNPLSTFKTLTEAAGREITLTVFKGAYSFPHREQPEEFVKVCRWFFRHNRPK